MISVTMVVDMVISNGAGTILRRGRSRLNGSCCSVGSVRVRVLRGRAASQLELSSEY